MIPFVFGDVIVDMSAPIESLSLFGVFLRVFLLLSVVGSVCKGGADRFGGRPRFVIAWHASRNLSHLQLLVQISNWKVATM